MPRSPGAEPRSSDDGPRAPDPEARAPEPWAPDAEPTPRRRTRVHAGELTSAACAVALLVLLFATEWYRVAGVPDPSAARPAVSSDVSGWHALTGVRWLLVATIAAALGSVALHASQRGHGTRTDTSPVLAALGGASAVLLVYRVLVALPHPDRVIDQKLGAVLGMLCAVGITFGAQQSMLEARAAAGRRAHRPGRHPAGDGG